MDLCWGSFALVGNGLCYDSDQYEASGNYLGFLATAQHNDYGGDCETLCSEKSACLGYKVGLDDTRCILYASYESPWNGDYLPNGFFTNPGNQGETIGDSVIFPDDDSRCYRKTGKLKALRCERSSNSFSVLFWDNSDDTAVESADSNRIFPRNYAHTRNLEVKFSPQTYYIGYCFSTKVLYI